MVRWRDCMGEGLISILSSLFTLMAVLKLLVTLVFLLKLNLGSYTWWLSTGQRIENDVPTLATALMASFESSFASFPALIRIDLLGILFSLATNPVASGSTIDEPFQEIVKKKMTQVVETPPIRPRPKQGH